MERYNFLKINKNNNLKKYYEIPIYPEIKKYSDDIYIITNNETRLDLLAYQYYNDPTLYWIIAIANEIYGTLFVDSGIKLRIPSPNKINEIILQYKNLNK